MKKIYLIGIGATVLLLGAFALNQSGLLNPISSVASANSPARTSASSASSSPMTGVSVSPQDIVPGLYPNPIKNTATTPGISVLSYMVENNTDASGKPVSDHLQFTLKNLTDKTLSNPDVYYTILDSANGKKEGYYKQLTGFSLASHGTGVIHFDGQSGYGHFSVNMHGIYGTATDQLKFVVEISIPGYAPVNFTAIKAPGGAEIVGQ